MNDDVVVVPSVRFALVGFALVPLVPLVLLSCWHSFKYLHVCHKMKQMTAIIIILLFALFWLNPMKVEGFHDRGGAEGNLFGCGRFGCNKLQAVAGYRQSAAHPLFIDEHGSYNCTSCLGNDTWCYDPPQTWADPPPLDYRVPKDMCYLC